MFYAIGHKPNTDWLKNTKSLQYQIECDTEGYVVHTKAHSSETTVEGVFASGDCADKKYRQAITAAGSGWYVTVIRISGNVYHVPQL